MRDIRVFGGTAGAGFAARMAAAMSEPLGECLSRRFANDCLQVQLLENCRERDVFCVQPLVRPVQDNLVELLLMADAARGASAARVTAVIPHFSYARSDKKDEPRISIGGRLVADLLATAGVDRVLTMTLHSPQVQAFFRMPVDQLHALRELARHLAGSVIPDTVVVSPDLGYAKNAATFARMLGTGVAIGAKQRFGDGRVEISSVIGEVAGRDVIVLDDEIASGGTVLELLDRLAEAGAGRARVACTHGLFSDGALGRITARDDVVEVVTTDTVPQPEHGTPGVTVLSVASAFAQAVRRIHSGDSVSALFAERPLR